MTQENLKKTVDKTAEAVAKAASDTGREALDAATASVSDAAASAKAAASDEAKERAGAAKDLLADQGHRFARDLRDTAAKQAGNRGEGTLQSRLLDTMADGVADVSEGLRGRSLGSLLEDADAFARRNPGAFVAGAALAGFAIARFAVATSPKSERSDETTVATGSDHTRGRPS